MAALIAVGSAAAEPQSASSADSTASQPAGYVERLRMLAQLQTLNSDLLSHDSATAVLQALCDRREAGGPRIRARHVAVEDDAETLAAVRRDLKAASNEPVRHRRVELLCGEAVLSKADNWYLPDRLTGEMNRALETTETPFGVAVRALAFQRRTLSAKLLFEPLPAGWEARPPATFEAPIHPPPEVLQHRAVLQTPDGRPFSLLVETYTDKVLRP
ncbi:MAG: hypothetical protein JF588_11260 [Caulobacterales bacterium]|nr:hypothetical protein [Caulobacterales bacterium]